MCSPSVCIIKCILFLKSNNYYHLTMAVFKLPFLGLSKAQRSFAQVLSDFRFECIGEVETDDEVLIGKYNY